MLDYIDIDVVYNHILTEVDNKDLWSMMNVNNKYKELTKKFVDNKAIERINFTFDNIFYEIYECSGINNRKNMHENTIGSASQFKQYLKENNATISGGFVLRSILNKNWKTDIDIYLPQSTDNIPLLNYERTLYMDKTLNMDCSYVLSNITNDINIKYVVEDYYGSKSENYKRMAQQNISCLQRICQKSDNTRDCDKDFDFSICKNTYWFDGKDNIKITNYCDVLTGNCKTYVNKQRKYYERLSKYIDRGFAFTKSNLFSCFVDFLQKYSEKELPYNNYSELYENHTIKYTITNNTIKSEGYYDHLSYCGSNCSWCVKCCREIKGPNTKIIRKKLNSDRNIVDDIKCFHYDKWQRNKTICVNCNKTFDKKVYDERFKYDIGDNMTIKGSKLENNVLCVSYLEADNISEIIKTQYNLQ